jgi:hypothetical protein
MKFMDVCTKKEFEVKGEKKTTWLKCGTLRIADDSKMFLELNHQPGTTFYVFEQKAKDATPAKPEDIAFDVGSNG